MWLWLGEEVRILGEDDSFYSRGTAQVKVGVRQKQSLLLPLLFT